MQPNIYVSYSTSELRLMLAPLNWFKPSSKIFLLTFQEGTFCGSFVLCMSCDFLLFMLSRLFIAALWSPAAKGLSWLLFVMLIVLFQFPMLYPGSGVVLDS